MRRAGLKILFSVLIISLVLVAVSCSGNEVSVKFVVDNQVYYTATTTSGSSLGSLPASPTMSGNRFDGWYFDDGVWTQPFNASTKVIEDISVYAHFVTDTSPVTTCRVIFDSRGGSNVNSITLTKGSALTLPVPPTKTGYDFAGWYYDLSFETQFLSGTAVENDITLYAKWNELAGENFFKAENGVLVSLTDEGKKLRSVTLPLTLNGRQINAVGEGLFSGQTELTEVTVPQGYTAIGASAFKGCTSLKKVNFCNSIESIGASAFEDCISLLNVQLPYSLEKVAQNTFKNCEKLEYVTWSNVSEIGDGAFYGVNALKSISVPLSVKHIGAEAFKNATSATTLILKEGLESVGESAFYNCRKVKSVTVPDSVTSIGKSAFYNIWAAVSVTVGSGITEIADNAFREARECTELTIKGNVVSVGAYAFSGMKKLTTLVIPSSVTSIGKGAFRNLQAVESVVLPSQVIRLEDEAFYNCSELQRINLENVEYIGAYAFYGAVSLADCDLSERLTYIGTNAFAGCVKLEGELTLPDSVETIAKQAFSGCTGITVFNAPASLKLVGDGAFLNCSALYGVNLNGGLETMGGGVFSGCVNLKSISVEEGGIYRSVDGVLFAAEGTVLSVYPAAKEETRYTVPSGVVSLGSGAFCGNDHIEEVNLPEGLTAISSEAFKGCENLAAVKLPSTLVEIGSSAFYGTNLTGIDLPMGVRKVGDNAFAATYSLADAVIPASVLNMGESIFYYSSADLKITLDFKPLTAWSSRWLDSGRIDVVYTYTESEKTSDGVYEYIVKNGIAALTGYVGTDLDVTVPESISGYPVKVLAGTFENNDSITSVVVPSSVEIITEMTFAGTDVLEKIILPFTGAYRQADGAEALAGYIFRYSASKKGGWAEQTYSSSGYIYALIPETLSEIEITESVKVAYGAFSGLKMLEKVTFNGLQSLGVSAFSGCSSLKEIVTGISLGEWEALSKGTNWNKSLPSDVRITCSDSTQEGGQEE